MEKPWVLNNWVVRQDTGYPFIFATKSSVPSFDGGALVAGPDLRRFWHATGVKRRVVTPAFGTRFRLGVPNKVFWFSSREALAPYNNDVSAWIRSMILAYEVGREYG